MQLEQLNHQVGVQEKALEFLTINIIYLISTKRANKKGILKDFVGFLKIIWDLMKI